jgi:chloramphenicol 3-O-phosphotransferase
MTAMSESVPVLLITGPVGAGKTAVAAEVSELLAQTLVPHAMVDLDALRRCFPRPAHDRFHAALGLRNLAAIWENFRAAGAARLVLAAVVEDRAGVSDYVAAIPGAAVQVVRLQATLPTLLRRLEGREAGASLNWSSGRSAELVELMERARVEDILVDTERKTIAEVAGEVVQRSGWLPA